MSAHSDEARASTYDSLADYNADVEKARAAYAADMAVQSGLCATCQRRKRDGRCRLCWTCRHTKEARR